eukprot:CAMPEP_0184865074 /NCGR_PEP_ID=MMETSP0580-20130426/16877_1 /TAXON_ID=1118495 /ORGANISM="Dactyliosolen fragilissimus" /LENGTH=691 /DNA_ID=CAMNT_0027364103 /DNA_START=177 /DNA_END=2252 /DNA_ORIENTATION=+
MLHKARKNKNGGNDDDDDKKKKLSNKKSIDLNTLTSQQLDELSYYDVLGGIPMHSTPDQIRKAFHRACLKYHPDKEDNSNNSSGNNNSDSNTSDANKDDKNNSSNNSNNTGEDPVFLKVKEAFETLSNAPKRKTYDSTVDFDDSVPSLADIASDRDFYTIFGSCFDRNLRFASEYDPDHLSSSNHSHGNNNNHNSTPNTKRKKKKNSKNQNNNNTQPTRPNLGNDDTPLQQVHQFYDYWTNFESWRDFTLPATKLTEHDTDMAECRYEKRWMEKEIARKAKAMKREEMARISKLVERAMNCDPRLKREKERLERDKIEKERLKQEEMERIEKEEREGREREERERVERERREKEERANSKLKRDREKKMLRKARQSLRKAVFAEVEKGDNRTWNNTEEMNDDIELLCEKLNTAQLEDILQPSQTSLSSSSSSSPSSSLLLATVKEQALNLQSENEREKREELRKKKELRAEAEKKEAEAKAKRASKPFSKEEVAALVKAVKKYPAGGANRWEAIALFINNMIRAEEPRSKEEFIEKYNSLSSARVSAVAASAPKPASTSTATAASPSASSISTSQTNLTSTANAKNPPSNNGANGTRTLATGTTANGSSTAKTKATPATTVTEKENNNNSKVTTNEWTEEQDLQLQKALKQFPSTMDKNERWSNIAKSVTGKNKKECVQRFKIIREALKKK